MTGLICCGKPPKLDPISENSQQIDKLLEKEKKVYRVTHRLLLLGAGESGKSTIVKQMQIINLQGFGLEECLNYIPIVRSNVRHALISILKAMKSLSILFENDSYVEAGKRILDTYYSDDNFQYTQQFFDDCIYLWKSRAVQECYGRSNEYHIIDSAKYFLDKVSVLRKEDYMPNEQDILRSRVLTTQITEIKFKVKDAIFHMFDVGGQRDQRRKWIQCFNDATAIVFVTALSGYNMCLREDATKNRLQESLELFEEIWTNRFLIAVSVILFLNKQDLLLEKVVSNKFKIEDYFPAYEYYHPIQVSKKDALNEPAEFTRAKYFFRDCFLQIIQKSSNSARSCFPHFTCAVDTDHMRKIFEDCRIMIQRIHLERFGILAMDS